MVGAYDQGFQHDILSRPTELVPSRQMRRVITASRRANPTMAFCRPRCLATFIAHALSHDHFVTRVTSVCVAS